VDVRAAIEKLRAKKETAKLAKDEAEEPETD
jgi:hypothetical protein